jgi:hypothetical protein
LDFAGEFFALAFSRQVGVVRDLTHFLFNGPFDFMKLAFNLVFRARLHRILPAFPELTFSSPTMETAPLVPNHAHRRMLMPS